MVVGHDQFSILFDINHSCSTEFFLKKAKNHDYHNYARNYMREGPFTGWVTVFHRTEEDNCTRYL